GGGCGPAWRPRARAPVVLLPAEAAAAVVDPYAAEAPPARCPHCADTQWHRAGTGWACVRCHPPVVPDEREVCPICHAKGACRADHPVRLRELGEQLRTRTRKAAERAAIDAALAQLPPAPARARSGRRRNPQHSWGAPRIGTGRLSKEIVWHQDDVVHRSPSAPELFTSRSSAQRCTRCSGNVWVHCDGVDD